MVPLLLITPVTVSAVPSVTTMLPALLKVTAMTVLSPAMVSISPPLAVFSVPPLMVAFSRSTCELAASASTTPAPEPLIVLLAMTSPPEPYAAIAPVLVAVVFAMTIPPAPVVSIVPALVRAPLPVSMISWLFVPLASITPFVSLSSASSLLPNWPDPEMLSLTLVSAAVGAVPVTMFCA